MDIEVTIQDSLRPDEMPQGCALDHRIFRSVNWLTYTFAWDSRVARKSLSYVVLRKGGDIAAIMPVPVLGSTMSLPGYSTLFTPFYGSPEDLARMVRFLAVRRGTGFRDIRLIDVDPASCDVMTESLRENGYFVLPGPGVTTYRAGVDEYLADKKMTKRNDYYLRRIGTEFSAEVRIFGRETGPDFEQRMDVLFRMIEERQRSKGKRTGITAYHKDLWLHMPVAFHPTLVTLENNDRLLAGMFISHDAEGLYYWTGGIVTGSEYAKYSFGDAVIHAAFKYARGLGLAYLDFLWGAEEYKRHFKGTPHSGQAVYATSSRVLYARALAQRTGAQLRSQAEVGFRTFLPQHSVLRRFARKAVRAFSPAEETAAG